VIALEPSPATQIVTRTTYVGAIKEAIMNGIGLPRNIIASISRKERLENYMNL